jgi:hypothetical protein
MPIDSAEDQAKSYRYLRIAMVGLLVALAVAVFYQSGQQGFLLPSVSAYYYTPAQAVFVGALVGVGASMIALQGRDNREDMFLNLGGIFAIVVAMIPTGRGPDFQALVKACHKSGETLLTGRDSKNLCPTVLDLERAARANVENNVTTLLIVGGLVLVLAGVILFKGRKAKNGSSDRRWVWAGFSVAALLWLCGLIARVVSIDWLAGNGHTIAGLCLLACILAVAVVNALYLKERPAVTVVNALRFQQRPAVATADARRRMQRPSVRGALKSLPAHRYTWIAIAMLAVAVVLIPLWLTNVISLFWVEISVAFLFVLFWVVQIVQLEREARTGVPGRPESAVIQ